MATASTRCLLSAIVGLFVLLPCAGCEKRVPSQGSNGPGRTPMTAIVYQATLYHEPENSVAVRIAEGRLWLDAALASEGEFGGNWELSLVRGRAASLGRLQGSGTLRASNRMIAGAFGGR
jgi:hypothetical protein